MQIRQIIPNNLLENVSQTDPFHAFTIHRWAMLKEFQRWAETHPDPADIQMELDGTVGALWGIAATLSAASADSSEGRSHVL